MIRDYFLNFWIWWYFVKSRDVLGTLMRFWLSILGYLNVVPMLSNLFVPLYQDYSGIGRFISFTIRFVWGFFGSIVFLVAGVPIVALILIYLLLPLVTIYQIINFFV